VLIDNGSTRVVDAHTSVESADQLVDSLRDMRPTGSIVMTTRGVCPLLRTRRAESRGRKFRRAEIGVPAGPARCWTLRPLSSA
jgi:hypothetical protein